MAAGEEGAALDPAAGGAVEAARGAPAWLSGDPAEIPAAEAAVE
jgi:hypothetical protein